MSHPVLANSTDGSVHWVHLACALQAWGLSGYQSRDEQPPGHPCCLCGKPASVGALVGHPPTGMPCQGEPALGEPMHAARHVR